MTGLFFRPDVWLSFFCLAVSGQDDEKERQ
jgi:hypothetical protein